MRILYFAMLLLLYYQCIYSVHIFALATMLSQMHLPFDLSDTLSYRSVIKHVMPIQCVRLVGLELPLWPTLDLDDPDCLHGVPAMFVWSVEYFAQNLGNI